MLKNRHCRLHLKAELKGKYMEKIKQIKIILYNEVFKPDLSYAKKYKDKAILYAIPRIQENIAKIKLTANLMSYLDRIVNGTARSVVFTAYLKERNLPRIEDVIDKIRDIAYR